MNRTAWILLAVWLAPGVAIYAVATVQVAAETVHRKMKKDV